MLIQDAPLTFREFMTGEVPLAAIFREVYGFLKGRKDAALFGAHAVNAYCSPERMTEDVDILSLDAPRLVHELRDMLAERLRIAVRVREVKKDLGWRIYQARKPENRHLVDVRQTEVLPPFRQMADVLVVAPLYLVTMKVESLTARKGQPKALTDRLDLRRLLLQFPKYASPHGEVTARLHAGLASPHIMETWREVLSEPLVDDQDEGY